MAEEAKQPLLDMADTELAKTSNFNELKEIVRNLGKKAVKTIALSYVVIADTHLRRHWRFTWQLTGYSSRVV